MFKTPFRTVSSLAAVSVLCFAAGIFLGFELHPWLTAAAMLSWFGTASATLIALIATVAE